MADPLSLIASVVGVTTAAVQISKALLELAKDIRDAPGDFTFIFNDVHTFHSTVSILNIILEDGDVQSAIRGDNTMLDMMINLKNHIDNSKALLEGLKAKMEKLRKPCADGKGFRLSSIKWAMFSKTEVSKLHERLEATKSTLGIALDVITTLCCARSLAISRYDTTRSVNWCSDLTDDNCATYCVAGESTGTSPGVQLLSRPSYDHPDLRKTIADMESTYSSMKQISDSVASVFQNRRHAFTSEDRSLRQHLPRIDRDLSRTKIQIQRLRAASEQLGEIEQERVALASTCIVSRRMDLGSKWDIGEKNHSSAINIFFDCVSQLSSDASDSIDRIHATLFGSPDYRFESSPSFLPEQYTLDGIFRERVYLVAMMPSRENHRIFKYFLTYAETPRRWQRLVLSILFHSGYEQSSILQIMAPDNMDSYKILPSAIQKLLRMLLPSIELYPTITNLSISVREGVNGQIMVNSPKIDVTEDDLEMQMQLSDEKRFLKYIDRMDYARFVESDVVVRARIYATSYIVCVKSEICVEHKIAFASAGQTGENGFKAYLDDLKLRILLRDCRNVAHFIGVILNDTKLHLRGYLYEQPILNSIEAILGVANSQFRTIPPSIREVWARQIIESIVEVHDRGLVAGRLNINSFGVRADGTAVLFRLDRSGRRLRDCFGEMPPELRKTPGSDDAATQRMNFQTDIFQLGLILWLLMEQKPKVFGYLCARAVCTYSPRFACTADHTNPVELPECRGSIPSYLDDIIRECRSLDPEARPSADKLAHFLHRTEYPGDSPIDINDVLLAHPPTLTGYSIYCDECGALTTEAHYHCNVCRMNNLGFCELCYNQGTRCVEAHILVKRILSNGGFVDAS